MQEKYPEFKAGIYQHYKEPLYQVLGLAHDANDADRTVVVYIGLELDKSKGGPRLAVRTYEDFYAWVDPTNGESLSEDSPHAVPRFKYLGHSLDAE